jgi:hypothetical protein
VVHGAADLSPTGVARALDAPFSGEHERRAFTIVESIGTTWSEAALPDGASAVLCVGEVQTRPRVGDNNNITARPISLLVLIYDARVLDQRAADAFSGRRAFAVGANRQPVLVLGGPTGVRTGESPFLWRAL